MQKLADLFQDRLEPFPLFRYSVIDYFDPWYIKDKRKNLKRYGVLFICLNSRAKHLEVAQHLDFSSFIIAYRRFCCRWGPIFQLRSDQGTKFVDVKTELQRVLEDMDLIRVQSALLKDGCDWKTFKMNPSHASHMGGVWERQIWSVRAVMQILLNCHRTMLNEESIRTVMVEPKAFVNSRPFTVKDLENPFEIPLS